MSRTILSHIGTMLMPAETATGFNRSLYLYFLPEMWNNQGSPGMRGLYRLLLLTSRSKNFTWLLFRYLHSASWAFNKETGMLPCLTSQILSIPSWPPVATMCCWLGCLSTQCSGILSPVLDGKRKNTMKRKSMKTVQLQFMDLTVLIIWKWSAYSESICEGSFPCCLKSHTLSWPIELTVRISVVRRQVTAWSVLLSALSIGNEKNIHIYLSNIQHSIFILKYSQF